MSISYFSLLIVIDTYSTKKVGASINVENGENTEFESYPPILSKIPASINNVYYEYHYGDHRPKRDIEINKLHEKNNSIIFLSHNKGYRNLIGVFNDMIGFSNMQYIGPLRFYPERDETFKELDSDESVMSDSKTSWSLLKRNKQLRKTINNWLTDDKKLKTPYEIKYRKLYDLESSLAKIDLNSISKEKLVEFLLNYTETKEEMVFEDLRNNTQISNRDLGLGISQVLPILISTNTHKNITIAVEQPELHLHPAVQCEIADEFIRSYKENKNEFLIETHSEHLLLRIMKRMRYTAEDKEGRDKTLDLIPDDVCLLYIDSHKGNTFIRELKLDKDGSLLSRWPSGFFEESYNEMFS